MGTGTKTFTVASGLSYTAGQPIRMYYDVSNYMYGAVASYSGLSLTVTVASIVGSGTYASWNIDYIYAGGGGGGSRGTVGTGGAGGGGAGSPSGGGVTATSGTTNTGGGGGGTGNDWQNAGQTGNAGSGGSGIVIIRYADSYASATATTGSPNVTIAGGYRIYKWTSSGSITF
jgi:hypothetical protein